MNSHIVVIIAGLVLSYLFPSPALAVISNNSQACNGLYGLPPGTVAQGVDIAGTMSSDACAAKAYINAMPYNDLSGGACPTPQDRVTGLSDAFAVCAANFFKAYQERHGKLTITTAYRPPNDNSCRGGAGASNHLRGFAIDVNPQDGNYRQLWEFSKANPQFGICFPHQDGGSGTTGYYDRPHMILAGIGGKEAGACAQQGIPRACEAGKFDPSKIQEAAQGPVQTPTSGLTDALRQYLGGGQQPASTQAPAFTAAPATGATPTGGSVPTAAQPISIAQPGYTAVPASTGSGGSSGGSIPATIAVPTYQQPSISQPTPVSSIIDTPRQNPPQQDPFALLNALARPTTTTQTATGTPLSLNADINQNIGTIPTATIVPLPAPASTSSYALAPSVQTFTSPDLRYSGTRDTYTPPHNTTLMARTLETLRQTLVTLLTNLQPFGRVRSVQEDAMHID